jgi:hypothetical protein
MTLMDINDACNKQIIAVIIIIINMLYDDNEIETNIPLLFLGIGVVVDLKC